MSRWSIYRTLGQAGVILAITLLGAALLFAGAISGPAAAQPPLPTPATDQAALLAAIERARTFTGSNTNWEPFVWEFDGLPMVLVPVGCFPMGSNRNPFASPIHRICFKEPFWIGLAEVTNLSQTATWYGTPREASWDIATTICQLYHARLPTEAEWEYAARGPLSWVYPWGDEFNPDNVVYSGNSNGRLAVPGSRPGGASWVGAQDMSGNAWEWVADWFSESYYYQLEDGVVNPPGPATGTQRIIRGGSAFAGLNPLSTWSRMGVNPDQANNVSGFRCARSLNIAITDDVLP